MSRATGEPERILVRGPNPVGDLVMATASFADLRRSFPRARITLLLKPGREAVVGGADYYDELLTDESHLGTRSFFRLVGTLRLPRFDLALIFTHSLRSALAIALARIPRRTGYPKGGQGVLLTERVPPPRGDGRRWKPTPMPEIYARLVEHAGAVRGDGWPLLTVTAELEERYEARRRELGIASGERLVGLAPGAAFGASKLWPPARLAALADRITERYGLRTIVFSGPGEERIAEELVSRMQTNPITTDRPLGLDLLKPFIRDLRLLVTMDTGPRHYATAFRVPAVVIMGPTHPDWTAANLDFQEIVRHDVPCGPCQLPVCPLDHRCMLEITSDEVLERVDARLGLPAA